MVEEKNNDELTVEELDKVVGGARLRQTDQPLMEASAEEQTSRVFGSTKKGEAPDTSPTEISAGPQLD